MNQQNAMEILKTGRNVFLTGEPGAGKTYTINTYIDWLGTQNINGIAVTASTGIAATHIGGRTIHAWSGIGVHTVFDDSVLETILSKERIVRQIQDTNVLIIDEVSMLSADQLDAVNTICCAARGNSLDSFGGIQVIFSGDFFQLPPVVKNEEREKACYAFLSDSWKKAKPISCYLTEQYRQEDMRFLNLLRAVRGNAVRGEHYHLLSAQKTVDISGVEPVHLYSHNEDIDSENDRELDQLPGTVKIFEMRLEGNEFVAKNLAKNCLSPEILKLKKGAKVMFTKNNPAGEFMNGTLGTVVSFDKENGLPIVEKANGEKITVPRMEWDVRENDKTVASITQVPLRLAWAITIHKSQGISLDAAKIDLSKTFEKGQGYVALSRVRTLSGMQVVGINKNALEVSEIITKKDREFFAYSGEIDRVFTDTDRVENVRKEQDAFVKRVGRRRKK